MVTPHRVMLLDQYGNSLSGTGSPRRVVQRGGVRSDLTGLGTGIDKADGLYMIPTVFDAYQLEKLYVESWAAARFVDIPVDDMLNASREYVTDDMAVLQRIHDHENELNVTGAIGMLLKAARLYGTGLCVMMTEDNAPEKPMDATRIKPGDLRSLLTFSRYEASVANWTNDPYDPNYGRPEIYRFQLRFREPLLVHHSRVLRVDGRHSVSTTGWYEYERSWGISELHYALNDILNDTAAAQAAAHLTQEASVGVLKMQGFRDTLAGLNAPDEPQPEDIGRKINVLRSIFRTVFIDSNDEFSRVQVNFAGLADMIDRNAARLAAIAGIPRSRFLSETPSGFFATEADTDNWARHIQSMKQRLLGPVLRQLDQVLLRSADVDPALEYHWNPMVGQTEEQKIAETRAKVEMYEIAVRAGIADENEVREQLSGNEYFGTLEPIDEPEIDDQLILEEAAINAAVDSAANSEPAARAAAARGGTPAAASEPDAE